MAFTNDDDKNPHLLRVIMDMMLCLIFAAVYVTMLLGRAPGLALDRTGAALLGATGIVVGGWLNPHEAWLAVDMPTIGLLLGLMVVSAQFRLGGFYTRFTRRLAGLDVSPPLLLGIVIFASGLLSALLCNDIICLAMAPVLAAGCAHRKLNPLPFLLALACASNVGSAATLIGNPQNMLIGQVLKLDFARYLWQATPPTIAGLLAVWVIIGWLHRGDWHLEAEVQDDHGPDFDAWQTGKGFAVLTMLVLGFLLSDRPREILALAAAGTLLLSRKMHTRSMLSLVDWQLLVLFAGLFIVNQAMAESGNLERILSAVRSSGIEPSQPAWLFALSVVLSNLVSNVPATMLLLPLAEHSLSGALLALSSTFAGNLLIVGSIANIIVVEQSKQLGIRITWAAHARVGVPVTLVTLALAAAWLYLLALLG